MLTLETQNIYSERDKSFTDLQEVIRSVSVWLLYVNSTLTPIVYANRDGVLRRRFLSFWTFERRSKKSQDTSENEVNGIRPGVTMTRSGGQNERQRLPLTGYVCANAEE
ncbi:unnamed protein product [Protopolystoma xenopodis]|uniref:Uncharacterized protein n=1 Tax=Protopolystoma xenopodis TaxID=117903 RepID=A0A448WIR9_9PLAT|nr:unnamed protein product [Protopolystoma xenopodis]